jgi:hypothetical protein
MEKNQEITSPILLETGQEILINGVAITPEILDYLKGWRECPRVLEAGKEILINGAIINSVILSQIESLQNNGNDIINDFREVVSDSICQLLCMSEDSEVSGTEKDILLLTRNLSYCREYLEDLRKPVGY